MIWLSSVQEARENTHLWKNAMHFPFDRMVGQQMMFVGVTVIFLVTSRLMLEQRTHPPCNCSILLNLT